MKDLKLKEDRYYLLKENVQRLSNCTQPNKCAIGVGLQANGSG